MWGLGKFKLVGLVGLWKLLGVRQFNRNGVSLGGSINFRVTNIMDSGTIHKFLRTINELERPVGRQLRVAFQLTCISWNITWNCCPTMPSFSRQLYIKNNAIWRLYHSEIKGFLIKLKRLTYPTRADVMNVGLAPNFDFAKIPTFITSALVGYRGNWNWFWPKFHS